ncbi:unnamed protein product [Linum trigynum]|uniref:DUF3475 domain-containing protein n=1 Tax=Linum trigynum TaxID=586398 RepID=A0AAV2GDX2_9ROSI
MRGGCIWGEPWLLHQEEHMLWDSDNTAETAPPRHPPPMPPLTASRRRHSPCHISKTLTTLSLALAVGNVGVSLEISCLIGNAIIRSGEVSEVSSLLGRAGRVGLDKAEEVLDTLGSSMTNLNPNSGFTSGVTTKGNKIAILVFEVANSMQPLSKENIILLKEAVLASEGVQNLVSRDMEELLRIAASDKREELIVFFLEKWYILEIVAKIHNGTIWTVILKKLGSELTPERQLREEAETMMKHIMTMVQYTAVSF